MGRERLGSLADVVFRQAHHLQRWNSVMVMLHVGEKSCLQGGVGQLVDAQGAEQRVGAHAGDQISATTDQPGLWPAQQLVAAVSDNVDACAPAVEPPRLAPGPATV